MRVSLIVTVKDEAESLPRLLDTIAAQTRAPDEIIFADGGSSDGTLDILRTQAERLPLKVLSLPGANISQGRNAAIHAASGDIICSTDAGVWLELNWVAELVRPFDERRISSSVVRPPVDIVSGFFVADPQSIFETALAATTLPVRTDIRPEKFLPSSRSVAFRRSAWEKVNGYPEWLDFCEDLIFDFALRAANYRFAFSPQAVAHFRPRGNLRAFCKQYYQYARGDGKADLWLTRHLIRYTTYLVALPLLIALSFRTPLVSIPLWLGAAAIMFYTPYKRLIPMLSAFSLIDKMRAMAWVPIIRVAGDIAKMIGYPVGAVWRVRNRSRSK